MRLVDVETLEFKEAVDPRNIKYAILSHRWERDEVSYKEMTKDHERIRHKRGYQKLVAFCKVAKGLSYNYVWVDTCFIDKRSSAELSEAINSMFCWYAHAGVCCAYLHDLTTNADLSTIDPLQGKYDNLMETFESMLGQCEWFRRAWTLQELISPKELCFYDGAWNHVGKRDVLASALSNITDIPEKVLTRSEDFRLHPIAERMSWAANRRAE